MRATFTASRSILAMIAFGFMAISIENETSAASLDVFLDGSSKGVLKISGIIAPGDYEKFLAVVQHNKIYTVSLKSDGGTMSEAIRIGHAIRKRHYNTTVDYMSDCASACALIWFGGTNRELFETGRVGFQPTYQFDRKLIFDPDWTNAKIAAYLYGLGYSGQIVGFVTSVRAGAPNWLTYQDAIKSKLPIVYHSSNAIYPSPVEIERRMDWPKCPNSSRGSLLYRTCNLGGGS